MGKRHDILGQRPLNINGVFISIVTLVSMLGLSACTQVDERIYPKGHYDSYYGSPEPANAKHSHQKKKIRIRATAPEKYIVQKGDTLWGISEKFLIRPWVWPEIWDKNQKIQNPHLIYPGDVLYLEYDKNDSGKLVPRIRIVRDNPYQPVSSLIPFLAWPMVLDKETIERAPYIVGSRDNHNLITEDERVYVKQLQASVGDRYGIFHKKKELFDSQTKKSLGFLVDYIGYARVERSGELATADIINAKREIHRGDKLFKPIDNTHTLNVPIRAPEKKVRGEIISLYDAEAISGQYMIAVINRGKRQGMQVGYTLVAYADGKIVEDTKERARTEAIIKQQLHDKDFKKKQISADVHVEFPPERVGTMVVYKVTNDVSFALIVESEREVKTGDKIGNP